MITLFLFGGGILRLYAYGQNRKEMCSVSVTGEGGSIIFIWRVIFSIWEN